MPLEKDRMQNLGNSKFSQHRWTVAALAIVWMVAALLLVVRLRTSGVLGAQQETESEVLARIAPLLDLPADADKTSILNRMADYHSDRDLVKKAHIARHLNMDVGWGQIFQHVEKMKGSEQAQALKFIADEYSLPSGLTRHEMQRLIAARTSIQPAHDHLMMRAVRFD
jgi:hypothetical protein